MSDVDDESPRELQRRRSLGRIDPEASSVRSRVSSAGPSMPGPVIQQQQPLARVVVDPSEHTLPFPDLSLRVRRLFSGRTDFSFARSGLLLVVFESSPQILRVDLTQLRI